MDETYKKERPRAQGNSAQHGKQGKSIEKGGLIGRALSRKFTVLSTRRTHFD
jgi:hypothetical protein